MARVREMVVGGCARLISHVRCMVCAQEASRFSLVDAYIYHEYLKKIFSVDAICVQEQLRYHGSGRVLRPKQPRGLREVEEKVSASSGVLRTKLLDKLLPCPIPKARRYYQFEEDSVSQVLHLHKPLGGGLQLPSVSRVDMRWRSLPP